MYPATEETNRFLVDNAARVQREYHASLPWWRRWARNVRYLFRRIG